MINGVLLINKDEGITSNSLVNKVKRILNSKGIECKKIGHAGTLDPNAKGLLVVLINGATKLSDYLLLKDKAYIAEIEVGKSYDTLDVWGKLQEEKSLKEQDLNYINNHVDEVLNSLKGLQRQMPPMYSSIKVEGRKLYELARANEQIDLTNKIREVEIFDVKRKNKPFLTKDSEVRFSVYFKVSKGTYIRSLAKTIGEKLGYPSSMSGLTRLKSGEFDILKSHTIEEIEVGNNLLVKNMIINMKDCIDSIVKYNANDKIYNDCLNGRAIKKEELNIDSDKVAIVYQDNLVAIYEYDIVSKKYKAKTVWN